MRQTVVANRVVVHRGLLGTLLDTTDAAMLEFRGGDGTVMAALTAMAIPGRWVFICKSDPGWVPCMLSSGYRPESLALAADKLPGRLRVFSSRGDLILDTAAASVVELYRGADQLAAVFSRHFNDDMWIYANEHDNDWEASKTRLGYGIFDYKGKNKGS